MSRLEVIYETQVSFISRINTVLHDLMENTPTRTGDANVTLHACKTLKCFTRLNIQQENYMLRQLLIGVFRKIALTHNAILPL